GEAPAVGTGWRWTQLQGAALEAGASEVRKGFCHEGELPGADVAAKSFVALETDSTFVHAWREKASHEIYLGIAYDGKAGANGAGQTQGLPNPHRAVFVGRRRRARRRSRSMLSPRAPSA